MIEQAIKFEPSRGVYDANRASALSGVPKSTLHWWVRNDVWQPSVSRESRTRLWSWGDLVVLRLFHWLRESKHEALRSPMKEVRVLSEFLQSHEINSWELFARVGVTPQGMVVWEQSRILSSGQQLMDGIAALVAPFGDGPHLLEPAPHLRIFPGKLSGEPHVAGTRILTSGIFALSNRGYTVGQISEMYPSVDEAALREAIELEGKIAA